MTAVTSILMPLSWLARVGNFCFNLLSPFLSIISILSSQAILFPILLYALFPQFPWSTLLPLPSYFKFHNLTCLEVDVSTDDMTIPPSISNSHWHAATADVYWKTALSNQQKSCWRGFCVAPRCLDKVATQFFQKIQEQLKNIL